MASRTIEYSLVQSHGGLDCCTNKIAGDEILQSNAESSPQSSSMLVGTRVDSFASMSTASRSSAPSTSEAVIPNRIQLPDLHEGRAFSAFFPWLHKEGQDGTKELQQAFGGSDDTARLMESVERSPLEVELARKLGGYVHLHLPSPLSESESELNSASATGRVATATSDRGSGLFSQVSEHLANSNPEIGHDIRVLGRAIVPPAAFESDPNQTATQDKGSGGLQADVAVVRDGLDRIIISSSSLSEREPSPETDYPLRLDILPDNVRVETPSPQSTSLPSPCFPSFSKTSHGRLPAIERSNLMLPASTSSERGSDHKRLSVPGQSNYSLSISDESVGSERGVSIQRRDSPTAEQNGSQSLRSPPVSTSLASPKVINFVSAEASIFDVYKDGLFPGFLFENIGSGSKGANNGSREDIFACRIPKQISGWKSVLMKVDRHYFEGIPDESGPKKSRRLSKTPGRTIYEVRKEALSNHFDIRAGSGIIARMSGPKGVISKRYWDLDIFSTMERALGTGNNERVIQGYRWLFSEMEGLRMVRRFDQTRITRFCKVNPLKRPNDKGEGMAKIGTVEIQPFPSAAFSTDQDGMRDAIDLHLVLASLPAVLLSLKMIRKKPRQHVGAKHVENANKSDAGDKVRDSFQGSVDGASLGPSKISSACDDGKVRRREVWRAGDDAVSRSKSMEEMTAVGFHEVRVGMASDKAISGTFGMKSAMRKRRGGIKSWLQGYESGRDPCPSPVNARATEAASIRAESVLSDSTDEELTLASERGRSESPQIFVKGSTRQAKGTDNVVLGSSLSTNRYPVSDPPDLLARTVEVLEPDQENESDALTPAQRLALEYRERIQKEQVML
ncbi:hypothetical protein IE53DRAFT_368619 [Violaceomyces palustris]|uniref:Uncharacterized protein n=1 Tax=Violaceomyces palustris TaxID=1673888 RepID=A0ACD0NYC1_9BASI|nr:hypothetical protein IE53DRAFT_368619 [Violaceomyces palustris]